jgi:ABC-2 type transport system permease protein
MMNNIKAVLHYEWNGTKKAASVFWIILGSTMLLSIIFAYSFTGGEVYMGGTSIALFTYLTITGFIAVKDSMPYCIQRGATRNQFLTGIGLSFLFTSITMAVIHTILVELAIMAGDLLNLKTVHFFRLSDLMSTSSSLLITTVVDMLLSFFFLTTAFLMGAIFYRFGKTIGLSFLAFSGLIMMTASIQEKIGSFLFSDSSNAILMDFITLFFIGVICFFITWPIIRKMSIYPSA